MYIYISVYVCTKFYNMYNLKIQYKVNLLYLWESMIEKSGTLLYLPMTQLNEW